MDLSICSRCAGEGPTCCSTKVAGRAQAGTALDRKRRGTAEAATTILREAPSVPTNLSISAFSLSEASEAALVLWRLARSARLRMSAAQLLRGAPPPCRFIEPKCSCDVAQFLVGLTCDLVRCGGDSGCTQYTTVMECTGKSLPARCNRNSVVSTLVTQQGRGL